MTFDLSYGALAMVGFFSMLLVLESLRPLRRLKRRRTSRWAINLVFTALGLVTGMLAVRPVALGTATWTQAHGIGLLNWLPGPWWAQLAGGILLMDFTFYHWHRLNHLRPWLWRFHNVHHVDPDMDVSTSFRFHFGEVLYSTGFRFLQVGLLGVGPATYLAYELLFNCATMFHHSNAKLPVAWERGLNKLLVTPRMHGVHHSVVARENFSNYSVVFSIWDRLHRSLRLNVPQSGVIIGVPGYLRPGDNYFIPLLTQPFVRQRPYWRFPSGKTPPRATTAPAPDSHFMAE